MPCALARPAALLALANDIGTVAVIWAWAAVRTLTFTVVWSRGRLRAAWARQRSGGFAGTAAAACAAVAELWLALDAGLLVAPAMMNNRTKIAITVDHMGCRRGQTRFLAGGGYC